jgi:hypothetical protein
VRLGCVQRPMGVPQHARHQASSPCIAAVLLQPVVCTSGSNGAKKQNTRHQAEHPACWDVQLRTCADASAGLLLCSAWLHLVRTSALHMLSAALLPAQGKDWNSQLKIGAGPFYGGWQQEWQHAGL